MTRASRPMHSVISQSTLYSTFVVNALGTRQYDVVVQVTAPPGMPDVQRAKPMINMLPLSIGPGPFSRVGDVVEARTRPTPASAISLVD